MSDSRRRDRNRVPDSWSRVENQHFCRRGSWAIQASVRCRRLPCRLGLGTRRARSGQLQFALVWQAGRLAGQGLMFQGSVRSARQAFFLIRLGAASRWFSVSDMRGRKDGRGRAVGRGPLELVLEEQVPSAVVRSGCCCGERVQQILWINRSASEVREGNVCCLPSPSAKRAEYCGRGVVRFVLMQ